MNPWVHFKGYLRKKTLTNKSISNLTHVYQPIYNMNTFTLVGFEALMRTPTPNTTSTSFILDNAREYGMHKELDIYLLQAAQENISEKTSALFLNIFSSTLLTKYFIEKWDKMIQFKNIVLELNQIEEIEDWHQLKQILWELNQRGIKIAIDRVGDKFSNLKRLVELQPNYIKIDHYFAKNLSHDKTKQDVVRYLYQVFHQKVKIILTGIENEEDFHKAIDLGITYGQGFYLGEPMRYEKLYQYITNNEREFYINYDTERSLDKEKRFIAQKIKVVRNSFINQYYDMIFEIPLCAKIDLIEINGKKVRSGKAKVCIRKMNPKSIEFLSEFRFSVDSNITLHLETVMNGYLFDVKGKLINISEIQNGVFAYTIFSLEDETELSKKIKILNDFQVQLRKGEIIQNTDFCGKTEKDKCIQIK